MEEIRLTPMQEMLRAVTRRHFFRQAGFGIGATALSSLINQSLAGGLQAAPGPAINAVNPLGAEASTISRQGEEHHLPVHGRGALASGPP